MKSPDRAARGPPANTVGGMAPSGSELDVARRLVVERGLARAAFEHLTVDAFLTLPFEALGPTKALLKRFFSTEGWGSADDHALAAAVGPGKGTWRRALDADVTLDYGWVDGRFGVRVSAEGAAPDADPGRPDPLAATFDGPVVPEATPNPRSIRFQVGPIHQGPSRWYESAAAAADDPGAARLFAEFEEVANVLVGPEFVAVGLRRPADWERLLRPVLEVVTDEFADPDAPPDSSARAPGSWVARQERAWSAEGRPVPRPPLLRRADASADSTGRGPTWATCTRAWIPTIWPGCGRRRSATIPPGVRWRPISWARPIPRPPPPNGPGWWSTPLRSVRRAAVDAMVDAGRPELRPLLETALSDADAWVRWKALRGLAGLGPEESRAAIEPLAADPDFRIRLEVAAALRATRRPG